MPENHPHCTVEATPAPDGSGLLMAITGELDYAPAREVAARMRHLRDHGIPTVLDLRGMQFVDSYGACTLLRAALDGRSEDWVLRMLPPTGAPLRVLQLCEIDGELPFTAVAG